MRSFAPDSISSTGSRSSLALSVESSFATPMRAASAFCCWSSISEMSGETTTTAWGRKTAGIWYVSDFPPAVGRMPSASRPTRAASISSRWPGRKRVTPKRRTVSRRTRCQSIADESPRIEDNLSTPDAPAPGSLEPQRFDRIEARRAQGRIEAGQDARHAGEQHRSCHRQRRQQRRPLRLDGSVLRDGDAETETEEAADDREHHGLGQELEQHVTTPSADGHPDANLARPLGDRDEHHVGDADRADQKRDGRDRLEEPRDGVRLLLG